MAVAQALIDEACAGLVVTEVGSLKDGGQKTVRLVDRAGQHLVLKVIQVGSTSPLALQRAAREVALLEALDSDHVVKAASDLLELGTPPNGAAWLEEHLDGDDLADLVSMPWTWDQTAAMAGQVGRGLGAMHRAHVVHRDLSANNVRRTSAGVFKIMDPGFARYELLPSLTVGGHPGTLGFLSPEHLAPPPAGPTTFSDVFCLGILMWLALTGEPAVPYLGDLSEYVDRLRRAELNDAPKVEAAVGASRFRFLTKCLHAQPARRFRHGDELADELEGLA
jgi:eukaryotic-like serine/threonine-protein kinase